MNEKITAELDLPGVGLGAGVTVGCLLACYSEPMVQCVWLFIAAAVLAFSLFTGKRRFLAAGLLLGLVSMTVYQTWYAGSLQALAGSGIRAQCRIISVNYSNDRWSAGRALCVLDGKPALIDITCDSVLDVGDIIDGELLLETAEQGIFTFSDGVVLSGEVTELHSRSSDFSLLYHLGNLRSKAAERFDRIGGDEAELCKGLVLGIKDGFSYELRRDILQSGVSYMTAVSGAHITIFIAVLCELFGKRRRRLTSIVSFAAVLLMMAMFGFSASVVRSGIMLMITQSAPLFCRRTDVLNSLCAALLLMTVLTPFAAADPALLMSALGVFRSRCRRTCAQQYPQIRLGTHRGCCKAQGSRRGIALCDGVRAPGQRFGVRRLIPRGDTCFRCAHAVLFSGSAAWRDLRCKRDSWTYDPASGGYELLSEYPWIFRRHEWRVASM